MADRADFAPELGALKSLRPFVFWAQTTLPTVFDDSLSYYEVLTKLTKMVNTLLENEDTNAENIAALAEAYQELEDFTNNYFENLDVTQEINDKLDELVADGTIGGYVVERANTILNNYLYGEDGEGGRNKEINDLISEAQTDIDTALDNFATASSSSISQFELNGRGAIDTFNSDADAALDGIGPMVESWLDDNFTNPSSVALDSTLTVRDAAANAYATGQRIDGAENVAMANSVWTDYIVDSVSGSFLIADTADGGNPAISTGAPAKTMYVANVTPGETYLVTCVASSFSTTRFCPAYGMCNITYDAQDNPYYDFYGVWPHSWDTGTDPSTSYSLYRNTIVRIPENTTPAITHLVLMSDTHIPLTVRCSRLDVKTDATLTSTTLPAQGKATGDALDTKIPWPVTEGSKDVGTAGKSLASNGDGTTSWVDGGGDYDEEIENLQNDVLDLKSAINEFVDWKTPTNWFNVRAITVGECDASGTISQTSTMFYTDYIPVKPGDIVKVFRGDTFGAIFRRHICLYDSGKQPISGGNNDVVNTGFTVPQNDAAFARITCDNNILTLKPMIVLDGQTPTAYSAYFDPYYEVIKDWLTQQTADEIETIENDVTTINDTIDVITTEQTESTITDIEQAVTKSSGYYWNGSASASDSYFYAHITDLVEGDVVTATLGSPGFYVQPMRFVDAYNNTSRVASACVNGETFSYTVPENIDNVYISCYSTNQAQITFFVKRTSATIATLVSGDALYEVPKKYKSNSIQSAESYLSDYRQSLKKGVEISYFATFDSFTSLMIGLTTTSTYSTGYIDYFEITGTSVIMHRKNQSDVSWAHDLTIANYINVQISIGFGGAVTIKIYTNGGSFTQSNYFYLTAQYYPFAVLSVANAANKCLSFTCKDFQKRIVVFGDSYLSEGNNRWLYYLPEGAINNLCLNGYPGEASTTAIVDCASVFSLGSPKYALWCLGMNDGGDTNDTTPSSQWLTNVQAFISACEARNIVPVLATIPSVPTINNRAKSAWVRNSGYRYIDFASAVNSDSSGNWFTGMLSSDGIHPDAEGAKALCARAVTDLPEMLLT